MLLAEMKKVAKDIGLKGYSKMKKETLEKKLKKCGGLKTDFKIVCTDCNGSTEYLLNDLYLNEAHKLFYETIEAENLTHIYRVIELRESYEETLHDKLICP